MPTKRPIKKKHKPAGPPDDTPKILDRIRKHVAREQARPSLISNEEFNRVARQLAPVSLNAIFDQVGISIEDFFDHVVVYYKDDEKLQSLAMWYLKLKPEPRSRVTFDYLVERGRIGNRDLYVVLSKFCYDSGYESAKRLVGMNIEGMVQESIESALQSPNLEERKLWLQALGFFNSTKGAGTTIEIHNSAHSIAAQSAQAAGLPSFEETISMDAEDIRQVLPRQLPERTDELVIDLPEFMKERVEAST